MKFVRGADLAISLPLSLPLKDELQAFGVNVIPTDVVHKHMRDTIIKHRAGIYTYLGPLVYSMSQLHNSIVSSRDPFEIIGSLVVVLIASFFAGFGIPEVWILSGFLFVFITAFAIFDCAVIGRGGEASDFQKAARIWSGVMIPRSTPQQLRNWSIPEHLIPHALRVGWISGARVRKLDFEPDPILEVSRRRFLFVERAYIGGWDTGVPEIDNFC